MHPPSLPPTSVERAATPAPARVPGRADGVELIGRYEGSGLQDAPYLAKRRDGQVIQLTHLLFLVLSSLREDGDAGLVARAVTEGYGKEVSAENIVFLVDKKLRATGLVATPEGHRVPLVKANPLLALKLRLPLVPERVHRHVTNALRPLFWTPLTVVSVVAMLALDAWLISRMGTGIVLATQLLIYQPQLILPVTLLTILMVAWHEVGHATAARYGGANPGAMGVGVYLVWPVFYTDVTDAYRLDRRGRLRVDLGGVYFNTLFTLAIGGLWFATDHLVFLVFIVIAQMETLRQFLPFVRLDGYYVVCDMAGVPNLFKYMKPALARLVPFRRDDGRELDGLTRRARVVLTAWAVVTAPVLLVNVFFIVILGPRMAGAAWGSAGRQFHVIGDAFHRAAAAEVLGSALSLVFLLLPAFGMGYVVVMMLKRIRGAVQKNWVSRPLLTGGLVAVGGTLVALQVGFVWPDTFAAAAQHPDPNRLTTRTEEIVRPVGGGTTGVVSLTELPPPPAVALPPTSAPPPPPVEEPPVTAPPSTTPPATAPPVTAPPVAVAPAVPAPAPGEPGASTTTTTPEAAPPSTEAPADPPASTTTTWNPLGELFPELVPPS